MSGEGSPRHDPKPPEMIQATTTDMEAREPATTLLSHPRADGIPSGDDDLVDRVISVLKSKNRTQAAALRAVIENCLKLTEYEEGGIIEQMWEKLRTHRDTVHAIHLKRDDLEKEPP